MDKMNNKKTGLDPITLLHPLPHLHSSHYRLHHHFPIPLGTYSVRWSPGQLSLVVAPPHIRTPHPLHTWVQRSVPYQLTHNQAKPSPAHPIPYPSLSRSSLIPSHLVNSRTCRSCWLIDQCVYCARHLFFGSCPASGSMLPRVVASSRPVYPWALHPLARVRPSSLHPPLLPEMTARTCEMRMHRRGPALSSRTKRPEARRGGRRGAHSLEALST